MTVTETLGRKVLAGGQLTKKEAMTLYGQPLEELCTMADTVRARFHVQAFSLCTIVNGKSGRCTENCRFCAQSAHYHTEAAVYPLCDQEEILAQAKRWQAQGVPRFGIVTAGRRLSGREVEEMCRTGFEAWDIVRIYAEPFAHNAGSRRVLEKAGFALEGVMRCGIWKNGRLRDYCMYALLRPETP